MFLTILENEIWKFGRNLPLATFGTERVKETTKMASFMRMAPDYNSQPVDEREGKQPALGRGGGGHLYGLYGDMPLDRLWFLSFLS